MPSLVEQIIEYCDTVIDDNDVFITNLITDLPNNLHHNNELFTKIKFFWKYCIVLNQKRMNLEEISNAKNLLVKASVVSLIYFHNKMKKLITMMERMVLICRNNTWLVQLSCDISSHNA